MIVRIFDIYDNEIQNPDLELGYLQETHRIIAEHPAVEAVKEVFHYEYTGYPNGGKDRCKVIDVPAVAAKEAWTEYEDILRYVEYTDDELTERKAAAEEAHKQSAEYRFERLEAFMNRILILLDAAELKEEIPCL